MRGEAVRPLPRIESLVAHQIKKSDMHFVIYLVLILVGATMVIKSEWIYSFIGPIDWAEEHLGTEGGTRILIKLLGVALILGTFLWITGFLQGIVLAIFRPLTGLQ
jgi:hypothetical protein